MSAIILAGFLLVGLGLLFSLCMDGDLLKCIEDMVLYRSARSVRVSKVKGHATDAMVADGKVRREDKDGNDAADIAADFGRLRQPEVVIDARRNLLRAKKEWYSRVLSLHRFMVAIARESVNVGDGDGDGSIIDPLCWIEGRVPRFVGLMRGWWLILLSCLARLDVLTMTGLL